MAGIKEVADAAGVSTATVSRALRGLPSVSESTRARITRLADELGYVPSSTAAGLRSGRTMAVCVVVPHVDSWFYSSVLEGIDAELRRDGYDLVLFNLGAATGERERLFHSSILRRRGDAVLALCIDFSDEEREQLSTIGLPSMVVGGPVHDLRFVGIDEVDAATQATQHLIDLGHRDILFVGGGAEDGLGLNRRVPTDRRHGYERTVRAAGLAPDTIRSIEGEFSTRIARARMNEFLDTTDRLPTAVFAASDEMAFGVRLAAFDHDLAVPGDLSIIGIDDHPMAESFRLTTIAQHPFAQGATAARLVLDEIRGKPSRRRAARLPVELIVRSSTAAPPMRSVRVETTTSGRDDPGPPASASAAGPLRGRSPREPDTATVAVITPAVDGWFAARAISGIQAALLEAGHDMALYIVGSPAERRRVFGGPLADTSFDGVIAVDMPMDADADALPALGHPVISVGGTGGGIPAVSIDHEAAARFATEHLLRLGHTDIAHLAGAGAGERPESVQGLRLRGFRRAMASAGIEAEGREWPGEMTMPGGYAAARHLLADPRRHPTAIVAACDEMACGAIVAAHEFGITIPNQLSVTGIGGNDATAMFSLTTLRQDPPEQGRTAVALLLAHIAADEPLPLLTEFPFRLVVGSTTTAPRGGLVP